MPRVKYLGPASVFSHSGQDVRPGGEVDIDDATLNMMARHGHLFEGYNQEGAPLYGYQASQEPTGAVTAAQAGAGRNIDIYDTPPARLDQERGEQLKAQHQAAGQNPPSAAEPVRDESVPAPAQAAVPAPVANVAPAPNQPERRA